MLEKIFFFGKCYNFFSINRRELKFSQEERLLMRYPKLVSSRIGYDFDQKRYHRILILPWLMNRLSQCRVLNVRFRVIWNLET